MKLLIIKNQEIKIKQIQIVFQVEVEKQYYILSNSDTKINNLN